MNKNKRVFKIQTENFSFMSTYVEVKFRTKKMEFKIWLKDFLKERKIDVGVYLSYLVGILEDTIDEDEKKEMILDIVSSLIVRISHFAPENFPLKFYFLAGIGC